MSLADIHSREHPEPEEGSHAIPMPMLALIILITAFGVYYYVNFAKDSPLPVAGPTASTQSPAESAAPPDGEKIFKTRCAACHQATGLGLKGAFPPLAASEWALAEPQVPAAIVVYGISGEISVKGDTYRGQMPSFKQLSDQELAAVLTYVRRSWGNQATEVTPDRIAEARALKRDKPWAGGAELKEHFAQAAP